MISGRILGAEKVGIENSTGCCGFEKLEAVPHAVT